MRVYPSTIALVASLSSLHQISGFVSLTSRVVSSRYYDYRVSDGQRIIIFPSSSSSLSLKHNNNILQNQILYSTSTDENDTESTTSSTKTKKKKLGLITFDLDDTLYPIAPVLDEANTAFSTAMSNFGYVDIQPSDIVEAGKQIRSQITTDDDDDEKKNNASTSATTADPLKPSTVNHKEIRLAAIRREMEQFILKMKLRQTAEDWATDIDDLTAPVRKSAEKWARTTVHSSVVQAVYNAWEMERHHAAERHLFPDAISSIKQIQTEHPGVIVGAVTDGSANPMLMVFSLMPLFDFTTSWEDDIEQVQQLDKFQELSAVDKSDQVGWIYRLAVEKGKEMSMLNKEVKNNSNSDSNDDEDVEWIWVHVGDDLAYDVGGSATTGAKTVLVELADEYGQTARLRMEGNCPSWSTESEEQMANHQKMSMNASDKVDAKISTLGQLPEVISELLK